MNLRTEFIIGKENANEWSGIYGYRPDNHDDYFKYGEIYAVIRLQTEVNDFALENFAKIILDDLQHNYFSNPDESRYDSIMELLEDSVWKMKSKMEIVLGREEEVMKKGLDMEMAVVAIVENSLYLAVVGESKVFILRDGNFVDISDALIDTKMTGFLRTGSLELAKEDRLAMLTSKVLTIFDKEQLEVVMSELNINKAGKLNGIPGSSFMLLADENLTWNDAIESETDELLDSNLVSSDDIELPSEETNQEESLDEEVVEVGDQEDSQDSYISQVGEVGDGLAEEALEQTDEIGEMVEEQSEQVDSSESDTDLAEGLSQEGVDSESEYEDPQESSLEYDSEYEGEDNVRGKTSNLDITGRLKGLKGVNSKFSKVQSKVSAHFDQNGGKYSSTLNRIKDKITSVISKLIALFKQEIVGQNVRRYSTDKKRKIKRNRIIFAIVMVVLVVFLFTSFKSAQARKREAKAKEEATLVLGDLQERYTSIKNQIQSSAGLSAQQKQDIAASLSTLETDVKVQQNKSDLFETELDQLLTDISASQDSIFKIESFIQPQVVVDLGAQFTDASPSDLEYSNGSLFISDFTRNVIYRSAVELGSAPEVHISGLQAPTLLVKNSSGDIVVFDSTETSAVGKFSPGTAESLTRFPGLTPSEIGKVTEVAIYDGNNALYEIHQIHSKIFKRVDLGAEYAGGGAVNEVVAESNWKTSNELSKAIDIAAPYEIYTLVQGQGLTRYLGGGDNTVSFETFRDLMQEDYNAMANASSFDVGGQYLAIGIPSLKKIMIFSIDDTPEKNMTLIKQFVYRGQENIFTDINEIKINDVDRKIYVLDNSKVLKLDF